LTCSCWRTVHSPSLTVANSHSACFFAFLISSSYADSLNSVCGGCEFEFGLILYLINVVFLTTVVVGLYCLYSILGCYYIFVWFGLGQIYVPPSFFVPFFILIYFRRCSWLVICSFLLKKKFKTIYIYIYIYYSLQI
jgi:hypothetical protein